MTKEYVTNPRQETRVHAVTDKEIASGGTVGRPGMVNAKHINTKNERMKRMEGSRPREVYEAVGKRYKASPDDMIILEANGVITIEGEEVTITDEGWQYDGEMFLPFFRRVIIKDKHKYHPLIVTLLTNGRGSKS